MQFVEDFHYAVQGVTGDKGPKRESPSEFATLGIEAGGFLFGTAQKNYHRADEWLRILSAG